MANPVSVLVSSIPFNFYALLAVGMVLAVVLTGRDLGPMRAAEERVRERGELLRDGAEPLISDDVISRCIYQLRKELGERGRARWSSCPQPSCRRARRGGPC